MLGSSKNEMRVIKWLWLPSAVHLLATARLIDLFAIRGEINAICIQRINFHSDYGSPRIDWEIGIWYFDGYGTGIQIAIIVKLHFQIFAPHLNFNQVEYRF